MQMQAERDEAAAWFRTLRDRIVAAFEGLEDAGPGPAAPGRFELRETRRGADGGGGEQGDDQTGGQADAAAQAAGRLAWRGIGGYPRER